jgi:hypothetical protein
MGRPVGRLSPGAIVAIVLGLALVGAPAVVLIQGCGKSATTDPSKPGGKADVKAYLKEPVNKPEFEKAVMGRSTREITEMLGAPVDVYQVTQGIEWRYPVEKQQQVILIIRDDHVIKVSW